MDFIGCSELVGDDLLPSDDTEPFGLTVASLMGSFSCFSLESWVDSELVPGVLGALFELPKDAKAPDPSPNAEEAPTVGEATAALEDDVTELKGLDFPLWDDASPPKRFVAEKVRGESDLEFSRLAVGLAVDKESLLELQQ